MNDAELRFRGENSSNFLIKDNSSSQDESKKNLIQKHQQTNADRQSTLSLENVCWFIAAALCLYFTDILNVLLWDDRINKNLFYSSISLISVNIIIGIYLIYLAKFKEIESSKWNEHSPYMIPIATGCFVFGSIM